MHDVRRTLLSSDQLIRVDIICRLKSVNQSRSHRIWTLGCVLLTVGLFGCGHDEELTSKNPYADLIGSEYRVIVEDLYAYGIYQSPEDKSTIGRITLIPGVGIGGRDVAFRRHVPKGHIIRIISAWRQPLLFDNGVYYLVAVEGVDFPSGVPVNLELFRGNEGVDADLNPNVYVKLSSKR